MVFFTTSCSFPVIQSTSVRQIKGKWMSPQDCHGSISLVRAEIIFVSVFLLTGRNVLREGSEPWKRSPRNVLSPNWSQWIKLISKLNFCGTFMTLINLILDVECIEYRKCYSTIKKTNFRWISTRWMSSRMDKMTMTLIQIMCSPS